MGNDSHRKMFEEIGLQQPNLIVLDEYLQQAYQSEYQDCSMKDFIEKKFDFETNNLFKEVFGL